MGNEWSHPIRVGHINTRQLGQIDRARFPMLRCFGICTPIKITDVGERNQIRVGGITLIIYPLTDFSHPVTILFGFDRQKPANSCKPSRSIQSCQPFNTSALIRVVVYIGMRGSIFGDFFMKRVFIKKLRPVTRCKQCG